MYFRSKMYLYEITFLAHPSHGERNELLGCSFCMGKFQTQKFISLKKCIYLLETIFVLRLFKILSAPGRASASNRAGIRYRVSRDSRD
jgi:hypothetical protein